MTVATNQSKGKNKGARSKAPKIEKKVETKKDKDKDKEVNDTKPQKRVSSKDPKIVADEIKELLADLKESTDSEEKKRIRRGLRARGHYGGLGSGKGRPKVKKEDTKGEIEEEESDEDEE